MYGVIFGEAQLINMLSKMLLLLLYNCKSTGYLSVALYTAHFSAVSPCCEIKTKCERAKERAGEGAKGTGRNARAKKCNGNGGSTGDGAAAFGGGETWKWKSKRNVTESANRRAVKIVKNSRELCAFFSDHLMILSILQNFTIYFSFDYCL